MRLKPLDEFRSLVEERGRFILIQAEEITDHCGNLPIHVNASHVHDVIRPQGGQTVRETIANNLAAVEHQSQRLGRPMLAHVNHPNFGYAITAEDLAEVPEERFFEVYNGHPEVHHLGDAKHPGLERLWDIANTLRIARLKQPPLRALATDDSHNYFGQRGATPGRGWVQVRAKHLTAESLISAMRRGDFYASSGVTLADVRYDTETGLLEVEIQPSGEAQYTTQFVGTLQGYDPRHEPVVDADGHPLPVTEQYSDQIGQVLATVAGLSVRYQLTGQELYVRAVVTSNQKPTNPSFAGQMQQAWTQPVGWEKRLQD